MMTEHFTFMDQTVVILISIEPTTLTSTKYCKENSIMCSQMRLLHEIIGHCKITLVIK